MSDMKQLDARQELLVITMEECGELIQACSKALRKGEFFQYSDSESFGVTIPNELKQEIADVYAMIELMQEWDVISWTEIEEGVERKREKLKKWSKLIEPHPPKSEQKEMNFPRNSVTWKQSSSVDERGYGRISYNKEYTQDMTGTGDYLTMSSEPLSPEEEREWDRIEKQNKK